MPSVCGKAACRLSVCAALLVVLLVPGAANAVEGMWPVFALEQLNFDSLKAMGLQLDREAIYNRDNGGLCAAVVQLGGGTGSFVSPNGLIITNHHVAFGAVQAASTAEKNYVENGFIAHSIAEEIPAMGYNCYVIKSFEDVTREVKGALKASMTPEKRHEAYDKVTKKIIARGEKPGNVRCEVAAFDGGLTYILVTFFRIQDVRIVAVPPEGIGNFGGEIDNWMWPRHTGDYSFLRAYVAPDGTPAEYSKQNVPYQSKTYFPISAGPLKEGDFSFVLGYPGGTSRFASSYEIEDGLDFYYPTSVRYRKALIGIMEEAGARDPEIAVRVSNDIAGLANYLKNFEGMIKGLKKGHVLDLRREREARLTAAIAADKALSKKYAQTLPGLKAMYDERWQYREKSTVLGWMRQASDLLGLANRLYKWSIEKTKPDMQREPAYMERNVPSLIRRTREAQVNLVPDVERTMLNYVLVQAMRLPAGQRIAALDQLIGDTTAGVEAAVAAFTAKLYAGTQVGNLDERMAMLEMTTEQLLARDDSFINLAAALYDEFETSRKRGEVFAALSEKLNSELVAAEREANVGPAYPDANGTMRLSYGFVMGYSPADATHYDAFTRLSGVMEKETGESPFNSPKKLIEVARARDFARYMDLTLGDVPVDFLTDHDTTGGSSGSPILNARGELIGLCFDGNYEAIAGDYEYDQRVNRTINVDSRYILFTLDKVMGATELLNELSVRGAVSSAE
ncbi:MAG TPA: S46 family peptidase [bacterium]|nr:S46 family peptidase [bacterium]